MQLDVQWWPSRIATRLELGKLNCAVIEFAGTRGTTEIPVNPT